MGSGGISLWQLLVIIFIALSVWIYGRILNKAGYSRWWVILVFVPLLNIIMMWVFAFAKWPKLKRM